jgi:photosystem II stability/assembly factor-like uncharacterized protein
MRSFVVAGLTAMLLTGVLLAAATGADGRRNPLAASPPAGGPVPAGTTATSVSFISTQTGWVLGTARCAHRPCSMILRTEDRGQTWVGLPAPRERISAPEGSGLWGLRFADANRGFAYGNGIWQTTNGGASWARVSSPGRFVFSLEAVQDRELVAVTAACSLGGGSCRHKLSVFHRPIAGGRWRRVARSGPQAFEASIAVHGGAVWVLTGQRLFHSSNAGRIFSPYAQPCPRHGASLPLPASLADDGPHVYLLCVGQGFTSHTVKYVYRTRGNGSGWRLVGRPPAEGDGGELAAGSDRAIMLATYSAASWLFRSQDSGRRWRTPLTQADGGLGWSDLGFTTPRDGVVVQGPARRDGGGVRPGELLLSSDGGQTWHAVQF